MLFSNTKRWRHPEGDKALDMFKELTTSWKRRILEQRLIQGKGWKKRSPLFVCLPGLLQTTLAPQMPLSSLSKPFGNLPGMLRKNGKQVLRWTAAGLLEAETRFRRIKGYRHLPLLKEALVQQVQVEKTITA